MNILWISDGKKGHEKQVEVLLEEISKTENIVIKKEILLINKLSQILELAIYSTSLIFRNLFLSNIGNSVKVVSILSPNLYKRKFDIICSPIHDLEKQSVSNKVIYFEGSLAKVSTKHVDENLGFIGIGGINKHYVFDQDAIIVQIEFLIGLYPKKTWHLFTSRRTPNEMIDRINNIALTSDNLIKLLKIHLLKL